jgi:hypothetical protein
MREHILSEVRRIAIETGNVPGWTAFSRATGISENQWRGKFWARWGDVLKDAGYGPNEWTQKLETSQILLIIIDACRHYRKFPTNSELDLYRQINTTLPGLNTIRRHFGSQSGMIIALTKLVMEDEIFADIIPMLPNIPEVIAEKSSNPYKASEGFVYLIKSGDFYKIGRSDDIERRIKEIRTALPDKASL